MARRELRDDGFLVAEPQERSRGAAVFGGFVDHAEQGSRRASASPNPFCSLSKASKPQRSMKSAWSCRTLPVARRSSRAVSEASASTGSVLANATPTGPRRASSAARASRQRVKLTRIMPSAGTGASSPSFCHGSSTTPLSLNNGNAGVRSRRSPIAASTSIVAN
jgi:hypothetical protein